MTKAIEQTPKKTKAKGKAKPLFEENNKKKKPSVRLEEIGIIAICNHVANDESLASWCRLNDFAYNTVLDWIEADAERTANYTRAKECRAHLVFDKLDAVSEEAVNCESHIMLAGLRLKSDNIKWKLARMSPKNFGDKIGIGGADDMPPIQTKLDVTLSPTDAYLKLIGKV